MKRRQRLEGPSAGGEAVSFYELAEKRESRICRKSDHDGRKPAGGETEEHTLSRAPRLGRGEAGTKAAEGSDGGRAAPWAN